MEKNDSAAALPKAEPTRPMDWVTPKAAQAARKRPAVYSADSTGRRNTEAKGVAMNGKDRQRAIRELRGYMWSPGRPSTARREDRVRFWEAIATGASTEDAAAVAGVSSAVGARWFRQAGGMPSVSMQPTTNRFLSFAEREEIAILVEQKLGVR